MQLEELMRRIQLPEEARITVRKQEIPDEEYHMWKEWFSRDIRDFLRKWKEKPGRFEWALRFYLLLSCETYERYQKDGIPDEVYNQTFYDITIWCEECFRKYGIYGLEEVWWLAQSVNMKLFRLGRLQFEPMVLKEDMIGQNATIPAGTEVLNVHIPAKEPLDMEACRRSFQWAEHFFGPDPRIYVCDSWLLSPHLKEILPEESNIIRFQKMFDITKVYYTYPQAEQRVFQDILDDKNRYPERTILQKNLKKYLLEGNDPGIGVGLIDNIYKYI